MVTYGQQLRELRGYMPRTVLADKVGVSRHTIKSWEDDVTRPGSEHLRPLARAFNVQIERVLPPDQPVTAEQVESVQETLGQRIRRLRIAKELKQYQLASAMQVKPVAASEWESDQSRPSIDRLPRLANLLGVTVDELLRDDQPAVQPPVEGDQHVNEPSTWSESLPAQPAAQPGWDANGSPVPAPEQSGPEVAS